VIVPLAAGGNTDMMARLGAERLAARFGQPFIVENRPSAGGAIAAGIVANAAPDGYTILFAPSATLLLTPLLQKVNYDADKQLLPVTNDAVRSVMTCSPDYLVMGMSAVTFYGGAAGADAFQAKVEREAGVLRDKLVELNRNGKDIDAIVQVGTNLSMVRLAAAAELWLGKPVIAINTATYWHALRNNRITDRIQGLGRLLEDF